MLSKQRLDFISGSLITRNFDAIRGTEGDVDYFLELWMFECLDWLRKVLVLGKGWNARQNLPDL
jgi:hypothetical protein